MSNIKVIDINEEAKQEEPTEQPIEEAKEEVNEVLEKTPVEQESKTEVVEEVKEEAKPVKAQDTKPCVKTQDKLVRCPKCNKEMKLKSLRYNHEQKCQGTLEQKPVKPFSKPRAKPKPQPIVQEVNEQPQEQQPVQKPIREASPQQQSQPINPLTNMAHHYQLLQQQFIQQKREKYNNLCQSMFISNSKKR